MSTIADKNKVTPQQVLTGAGSIEILHLVASMLHTVKGSLVVPDPSFAYWSEVLEKAGSTKISVPLTGDKKHDVTGM